MTRGLTETQREILELVEKEPGLSIWTIGKRLKAHNPHRDVGVLEARGLLYTEKKKWFREVYLVEDRAVLLDRCQRVDDEFSLAEDEIKILKAKSVSPEDIAQELELAGGRVKSLVGSILNKYKEKAIEKAREAFYKARKALVK